jgi:hypothetical protein
MLYLRKQHIYRNKESGEGEGGAAGENQAEQQASKNTEIEDKARKMGWTPKEEFKGDPDKWRDASEFVERGENMLPIVKATVKKQDIRIAELERTIKDLADYHSKTEQRAYEKAFKELKAKQIEAVSAGDAKAFAEVDAEMAELHKQATEKPTFKQAEQTSDPVYDEWAGRNKWLEDKTLEKEAEAQAVYLRERGDRRTGTEFLDAVKERVKREFPDKFSNLRRENAPSVEGGTPVPRKGGGKAYTDMPAEARAACERMAKNGYSGDAKAQAEFKAQYVKQYFEEA